MLAMFFKLGNALVPDHENKLDGIIFQIRIQVKPAVQHVTDEQMSSI